MDLFALEDGATAMHQVAKAQFNIAGHTKITKRTTPMTPGNFLTLFVSLNHPFSWGNVHITAPPSPTTHESTQDICPIRWISR
jgi:hypothetical protein